MVGLEPERFRGWDNLLIREKRSRSQPQGTSSSVSVSLSLSLSLSLFLFGPQVEPCCLPALAALLLLALLGVFGVSLVPPKNPVKLGQNVPCFISFMGAGLGS